MKVTKQQLSRLATIEAKFLARSVRGLLPLKSATKLSNVYQAREELERRRGHDLNEDEEERLDHLQTLLPKMAQQIVLPAGHHYSYADMLQDEQRFYQLSRQRRKSTSTSTSQFKSRVGVRPLSRGDEIELAFLTAHRLLYEYSLEGIRRRKQKDSRND
jgi:hypothetical protein